MDFIIWYFYLSVSFIVWWWLLGFWLHVGSINLKSPNSYQTIKKEVSRYLWWFTNCGWGHDLWRQWCQQQTTLLRIATPWTIKNNINFTIPSSHSFTHSVHLAACMTVSGPVKNAACVFPFKFNGVVYNACKKWDLSEQYWCATELDAEGGYVTDKWGDCDDSPGCQQNQQGMDKMYRK